MINIAINGFGRIGRLTFKKLFEMKNIRIVAINDLSNSEILATLLEYDTSQGSWMKDKIITQDNKIIIDNQKIIIYKEKNPILLPWKQLNIDLVVESTGRFVTKADIELHIKAGAKKVIVSAPVKDDTIKTIVYGVNHENLNKNDLIISGASCTTNCLAPIVKILDQKFVIEEGCMTTIHAVTNDQNLLDLAHDDFRRSRAAYNNIIPTKTGAAAAISLVLPQLKNKINGIALRVPIITGSIIDLTIKLKKKVSIDEINNTFKNEASEILAYNTKPIVSSDIIGDSHGSIFDATLTQIIEINNNQLIKIYAWYDNEMSYVSQMVRTILYFITL